MKEENEQEEQKTEQEASESAETTEKAEVEEIPKKKEETVEEEAKAEAEEETPVPTEEETKELPPPREEKVEEEIVEERVYTIPLSKAWIVPPNKRAPKAMRMIKSFVVKHMKLEAHKEGEEEEEPRRLVISNEVNERVWTRGIEKPPRKIRIRAAKDKEGNVTVYLAEGD
jgi:large subunit ribosomal protein L31e